MNVQFRTAVIAAWLVGLWTETTSCQLVRGVVQNESGQPLGAVVVQLSLGERVIRRRLSDSIGRFYFDAPSSELVKLSAQLIGYRALDSLEFRLTPGETKEVRIRMSVMPVPIPNLQVTAARTHLERLDTYEGFLARRRTSLPIGNRRILSRDDAEFASAISVRDVLRWLPRLKGCTVLLVEGHIAGDTSVLDASVSLLEGLEFYRDSSDAPVTYRGRGCFGAVSYSVLALWLRRSDGNE